MVKMAAIFQKCVQMALWTQKFKITRKYLFSQLNQPMSDKCYIHIETNRFNYCKLMALFALKKNYLISI